MISMRHLLTFTLAWLAFGAWNGCHAQTYPSRPIRLVVPFPPGGATDIMARAIGQKLSRSFGKQVVIDNRAGAGGSIAAEIVARAGPDGHTLFFAASAQLAVNPNLYAKVPYDAVKDFAPVVLVGSVPNILVAHPSLAANSLKDLRGAEHRDHRWHT